MKKNMHRALFFLLMLLATTQSWAAAMEDSTIHKGQVRILAGIRDWETTSASLTAWTRSAGINTPWLPEAYQQEQDFVQIRYSIYDEYARSQPRQYSPSRGEYRNAGASVLVTRTGTGPMEARTVIVTPSTPVDIGPKTNCGTWSPDPSTVELNVPFTQTAPCDTTFQQTFGFSIGGFWVKYYAGNDQDTRAALGTRPPWVWTTAHSLGADLYGEPGSEKSGSCTTYNAVNSFSRNGAYYEQYCREFISGCPINRYCY